MLDLRYPMGMMFALVGAMLAIYGAFTNASGTKEGGMYNVHSLGLNINLYWARPCWASACWCSASPAGRRPRSSKRR